MGKTKDIRQAVEAELTFDPLVDAANITWAEHDAAVGAAWMATGVIDVRDDLSITG